MCLSNGVINTQILINSSAMAKQPTQPNGQGLFIACIVFFPERPDLAHYLHDTSFNFHVVDDDAGKII